MWRELRSGPLDGADGVTSGEGPRGKCLEVGLEENSEETISRRGIALSVTFRLLESVGTGDSSSCVGLAGRMELLPVFCPVV